MVELNIASSQFHGSTTELFLIVGGLVAIVVVAVVVFVILNNRLEKTRRTRIQRLVQQLDGRPLVYVPYADCALAVSDVLSTAQAHGYAMTPNGATLRYEFARGAPQTAFTGNPRAAYIAQMLDGRPTFELPILFEPMTFPS